MGDGDRERSCLRRVCDTLAGMGCCNSKGGLSRGSELLWTGLTEGRELPCTVGIMARELSAYDFASEVFALEYTQQVVTASVGQVLAGRGGELEGRTRNVPGDHATIQDALDAARDGDAVRIAPGRYKEAVVVNKRVLLVGVGKVGDTVLEGPDESIFFAASALPTLTLEASEARICNLTLKGSGNSVPVIQNVCGDLTLEGCQVRGGSCGIKVQESAGVIVRFCDVGDCKQHGIFVAEQGWSSVEKSHIFNCQCGVLVGQLGSQSSLRQSDVDSCSQVGVMVYSAAAVLLEDCNIHRNEIAGVCLASGARAVLSKNKVEENGQVGVMVVENSAASINDNELRRNGVWSIYVAKCSVSRVSAKNNSVDARHMPLEKEAVDSEDDVTLMIPRELLFSTSPSPLSPDSKHGDDDREPSNAPALRDDVRPPSDFTKHDSWRPNGAGNAGPGGQELQATQSRGDEAQGAHGDGDDHDARCSNSREHLHDNDDTWTAT